MQNGSIVVVKKLPPTPEAVSRLVKWLPVDDERTPYVLRDGDDDFGEMIWRLEEGVIGYNPLTGEEWGLPTEFLVEVLPPEENFNVEELVQELVEVNQK